MVWIIILPHTGLLPAFLVRGGCVPHPGKWERSCARRGKIYQYFSLKYTFILAVFLLEIGSLIAGTS